MEIIKPESVIGKPNSQALCCRFSTAKLVLQVQTDPCKFCWPTWPLTSPKGRAERSFRFGIYFPSGSERSHSRSSIPWIKWRGETDLQKGFSSSQVHIVVPHFGIWIWAQIQPSHLTKDHLTSFFFWQIQLYWMLWSMHEVCPSFINKFQLLVSPLFNLFPM